MLYRFYYCMKNRSQEKATRKLNQLNLLFNEDQQNEDQQNKDQQNEDQQNENQQNEDQLKEDQQK